MPPPSPLAQPPLSPQSPASAEAVALEHFGIQARAKLLEGDQDQNFELETAAGERFVLKFHASDQGVPELEEQSRVLAALQGSLPDLELPRVLPNRAGDLICQLPGGASLRLLSWVRGTQLVHTKPHSSLLLRHLGQQLGQLGQALSRLEPGRVPELCQASPWNLMRSLATIRERLSDIDSTAQRALLERWLPRIEGALTRAQQLPQSLLHNDANDYNVLVAPAQPGSSERRIAGLIDFGDLSHGPRVLEPAVAAAYAALHKADPMGAICQVAAGYHGVVGLSPDELTCLPLFAVARLCLSVAMSARQQRERPENAYLAVSEAPAWEALERLEPHSDGLLCARLRDACGLAPLAHGERLLRGIAQLEPRHVLPEDCYAHIIELDLSIGSLDPLSLGSSSPEAWQAEVHERMLEEGASLAVGRYDEARLCYTGEAYACPGEEREQRRSVHLGIDLFAPAGTPVRAPLAGRVHSVHDNAGERDYGPTVILEHQVEGQRCYSLYGHLGRSVLSQLEVGQELAAGERFAELGAAGENGGWPAHLHLQWILDLLGATQDFPGVAAPGQRSLWLGLCPDPRGLACLPPAEAQGHQPLEALQRARAEHHGPTLSLSYQRPLHIVRGQGCQLFDAEGNAYLDAVNNVPQVGHGHPHVVRAAARQLAVLNTNTRYLDLGRQRYLRRLCATLPEPLSVCYLVCSGSEANELALRLARAHSGRRGVAVLDAAYHGNTSSMVELSPYKFDGRGGAGRPEHVQVAPSPDDYRGPWKRDDPKRGMRYGDQLQEALERGEACGQPIGAFFAESLLGCAGQIPLPPGYLQRAYEHAHGAGVLCVADEVQVGFGRVGTHFWGFETQGVVPDIVTLGKPMGNGFPLAGVVTTPEIAASFHQGMEYFNTFGGSPAAAAVGNAVLDVIEREGLQANALEVGEELRRGCVELAERHPILGDVRGAGLFLGLELVHDPESLEPASEVASYVAERLRSRGILISTDGPLHNVLKIKPPLVFSRADAGRLIACLDDVLGEDPAQPRPNR